jgi:hypothetical protein
VIHLVVAVDLAISRSQSASTIFCTSPQRSHTNSLPPGGNGLLSDVTLGRSLNPAISRKLSASQAWQKCSDGGIDDQRGPSLTGNIHCRMRARRDSHFAMKTPFSHRGVMRSCFAAQGAGQ